MFPRVHVPLNTSSYRIESTLYKDSIETVLIKQIYLASALDGTYTESQLILKCISSKSLPLNLDRYLMLLTRIHHDNLLTTFDCFYEKNDLWIITPYFESLSLNKLLSRSFPSGMPDKLLVSYILHSVLIALDRIHSNLMVVRSFKPSKILIGPEGQVKLIDCQASGIVSEELRKKNLGQPYWTAPEVLSGSHSDCRSDIWSFGLLAYELVMGKNPWIAYPTIKAEIMITEKSPPRIPREVKCEAILKEVIAMCLQKDPHKRPSTMTLLESSYFKKGVNKNYAKVLKKYLGKDGGLKRMDSLVQPKPLSGEDPDEMLQGEIEDDSQL